MLKPKRDQVVAWRGPILDRALVQMLADVYWGDLDVLLLDLPPGTGDIAISVGQRLTSAEVIVVTTPQEAAAEVAERAGTMAQMVHQRVAETLSARLGYNIPLLGEIPLDERLRSGGDLGNPLVAADPETPAAQILDQIAAKLGGRPRGLLGRQLGLSPVGR